MATTIADLWNAALHNAGFTGTVPDMQKQWLEGVGGATPQQGDTLYLSGNETTWGSIRFIVNEDDYAAVEKLVDGIWQPASLMTGAATVWVGHNVGLSGVGHHLSVENADGDRHFYSQSQYNDVTNLSVDDAHMLNAYQSVDDYPFQTDDSGEWIGTQFDQVRVATLTSLLRASTFKFGSVAPTASLKVEIFKGGSDTDPLILKQEFPHAEMLANTEFKFELHGMLEFAKGTTYLIRYTSDETFSLCTNAAVTEPYFLSDITLFREDTMLQTAPYIDGDTYSLGQWLVHDRKIYQCNVTGVQTGTFTSNAAKWDLLGTGSVSSLHWNETSGVLENVTGPTSLVFNDGVNDRLDVSVLDTSISSPSGLWSVAVDDTGSVVTGDLDVTGDVVFSGSFGIGTSDMSTSLGDSRLKVKSPQTSFNAFAVESSIGQDLLWVRESTDSDGSIHVFDNTQRQTILFTSDEAVSYIEYGNFGVGTNIPTAKLEVDGDTKIWGALMAMGASDSESNTIIGLDAGTALTGQGLNTFIGSYAGENSLASNGVFIGSAAGQNEQTDNKLHISNPLYNLIEGDFLDKWVQVHGRLGVGSLPDQAQLEVHSASITTENIVQASCHTLTTGGLGVFHSGSDSTLSRELVHIHNTSALATGVTVLSVENDSTGLALDVSGDAEFSDGFLSARNGQLTIASTVSTVASPNGSNNLQVTNTYVRLEDSGVDRVDVDDTETVLRSPNGVKHIKLSNVAGTELSGPLVVEDAYQYMGDPTTDGSWRFYISGTQLVFERREVGVWVQKDTMG